MSSTMNTIAVVCMLPFLIVAIDAGKSVFLTISIKIAIWFFYYLRHEITWDTRLNLECSNCTDTLPEGWNSKGCDTCSTGFASPDKCLPWNTFGDFNHCFIDWNAGNASNEKVKDWCQCSCNGCGNVFTSDDNFHYTIFI